VESVAGRHTPFGEQPHIVELLSRDVAGLKPVLKVVLNFAKRALRYIDQMREFRMALSVKPFRKVAAD
jgi:hypothetical protein